MPPVDPIPDLRPTFLIRLLIGYVLFLLVGGGLFWYAYSAVPRPLSLLDIEHVADYEKLVNIMLPTAKGLLEKDGEVAQPIAFGIELNDQLDFVGPESASSVESLGMIIRDFKQGAHSGFYRAVAIAYDTTHVEADEAPVDAIEFRFEHVEGEALKGWFHYKKLAPGKYWYGVIHYIHAFPEIFSHHNMEWGEGD